MQRTKDAILKPIITDLSGGGLNTFSQSAEAFFSASLNKDKKNSFSDIELSKIINPFALTRAVVVTTGLSVGLAIDKIGSNTLPAQAAKAVLVTPFTTTAAILAPFSKIDEAAIAVTTAIAKSIENPGTHDKSKSEFSDPFKVTVTREYANERAHQESEYAKLSKAGNPHTPEHKHNIFSNDSKISDSKKDDEENTKDQSKSYAPR